jgi:hypothetical protein
MRQVDDRQQIRQFAGRALVGGLCVAAAAAVLALLTGSFDDTDLNVIATSLGFAAASATGSTGAAARLRPSESLRLLGGGTLIASIAAFVLLVGGLWTDLGRYGDEDIWRAFGCVGVLALAGAHACLLLGSRRNSDSDLIRTITAASVGLSAVDTTAVILPLIEAVDEVGEGWARFFGATLVLLVLTSVLPPILRRMQPAAAPAAETNGNTAGTDEFLASAVVRIADRIDVLNSDPGNRAPEIRAEVDRLRKLAQSFEN